MGEPCRRRALCRVARGVGRNVAWRLTEGGGEGGAHEWSLGWGGAKKQRGADERGRAPPKSRNAGKSYTKSQVLHKVSHKALHAKLSTQSSPHTVLHTLIQVFPTHTSIFHLSHTYFPPRVTCQVLFAFIRRLAHTHTHTHTLPLHPSIRLFPALSPAARRNLWVAGGHSSR